MATHHRRAYPSDLTDDEWNILAPLVPTSRSNATTGGRPEQYAKREIVNAILYVKSEGCRWRALPHNLPPWGVAYHYFRTWSIDGTWKRVNAALRNLARRRAGKRPYPTAAIIDAQSVKNTSISCDFGYDARKKIKGVKRHLLVDTLGLVCGIRVTPVSVSDRAGARTLVRAVADSLPRLRTIFADAGYRGRPLRDWMRGTAGWTLTVVKRIGSGFQIVRKRWIVERTFAWLDHARRLSKNYEHESAYAESFVLLASIHLMTRRLARQEGVI